MRGFHSTTLYRNTELYIMLNVEWEQTDDKKSLYSVIK